MTNRLGRPAPGIIGPLVIFEPSAEAFLQRLRRCHASTPLRRTNPRARQNVRRGRHPAADVTRDKIGVLPGADTLNEHYGFAACYNSARRSPFLDIHWNGAGTANR